jgi:hypothetical protein
MLSRRQLIRNGVAASALSGLPILKAFTAPLPRCIAIVDTELQGGDEFSALYRPVASSLHAFASDPGQLWMQVIEPALRRRPAAITGFTSASTLFCLQFLTRDYGLVLTGHVKGAGELAAVDYRQHALLDLQDPYFRDRAAGFAWRLVPQRG